jgi:GTP pyrophosphokinase
MVKVREDHPLHYDGSINHEQWLAKVVKNAGLESDENLRMACQLSWQAEQAAIAANRVWAEGKSSFRTGLEMADILTELHMDEASLLCAVVYRAVREKNLALQDVEEMLGSEVSGLVQGVLRMAAISGIRITDQEPILGQAPDQLDQARKMLISLVDDVRVAPIKIAERTCAIRHAGLSGAVKQISLAHEIFDIYAPLAHRLGIGHLKWELEDLAFRHLEADTYKQIADLLDEKRVARQKFVESILQQLRDTLQVMNIDARLDGRAKHIYSIWQKMVEKGIPFNQVYDVSAVRILVEDENDCYRVLGAVHKLWHNIPREFDDYIATPKENGYQSLHTAVFGPKGKVVEVQIRTFKMHEEAELGVCSHWRYKSGGQSIESDSYEKKVNWLRHILEWRDEVEDSPGTTRDLIDEINQDRIYVFTRDGHVVDLMPKATPLDFAYRVHTEVGNKCCGAKVNGHMVELNSMLKTGDKVEILTDEKGVPRREWLHEHLGYLNTSRARVKVQSWFRLREKTSRISEGREMLDAEFKHLGITVLDYGEVAKNLGFDNVDEFYARVGSGECSTRDAVAVVQGVESIVGSQDQLDLALGLDATSRMTESDIAITGTGDLPFELADCCNPLPGDEIVGVISAENTVFVHRKDCVSALASDTRSGLMEINWATGRSRKFSVDVLVDAYDRSGLMYDVSSILAKRMINMSSVRTETDQEHNRVKILLTLDVESLDELLSTLEKIEQIPNVIEARRNIELE